MSSASGPTLRRDRRPSLLDSDEPRARGAHAPLVAPFVGRSEQLESFRIGLEGGTSAARLVCVHGLIGSGRSRFANEAINLLRTQGLSLVVVTVDGTDLVDLPSALRSIARQLPCGGSFINRALSRTAGVLPDGPAAAKLVANALFQEIYNTSPERRSCLRPLAKRVVLTLDDFDSAPPGVQSWFGQEMLPQLMELRGHLDFLYILVTQGPLSAQMQPVAWNAQPARMVEIEIPRMDRAESLRLLASFGRRPDEASVCYELGEGLPGAMLGLLRHSLRPVAEISEALRQCSGPAADLLVAVAKLGLATPEGLRLALGTDEAAPWINRGLPTDLPVPFVGYLQTDGVSLPGPLARLVEQHVAPRTPAVARRASDAARTITALGQFFPADLARRRAAQLGAFRFFDESLLRLCFGNDAPAFLDLIRTHERCFPQSAPGRWSLLDAAGEHLRRYATALGDTDLAGLRAQAEAAWQDRAIVLKQLVDDSARTVKHLTADRDRVQKEIDQARVALTSAQRDRHTARTSRLSGDAWRLGTSLAINGAGVACLWAALFVPGQRASFVVLGALLIVFGLCTPAFARRNGKAESAVRDANALAQANLERAQGNLEFVETRYATLQRRLTEERRRADEAKAALQEPYIA